MSPGWLAFGFIPICLTAVSAAPVPKDVRLRLGQENSNALIKSHRAALRVDASSDWQNWPVSHAFDNELKTTWFSGSGDAPMNNATPWIRVIFPQDVFVRRITILGNRDPQYPNGYFILEGRIELLDRDGKVLAVKEMKGSGEKYDYDWIIDRPPVGVRAVRFTAMKDQGTNSCVGISEFQVE
jgi:hypothetical protein